MRRHSLMSQKPYQILLHNTIAEFQHTEFFTKLSAKEQEVSSQIITIFSDYMWNIHHQVFRTWRFQSFVDALMHSFKFELATNCFFLEQIENVLLKFTFFLYQDLKMKQVLKMAYSISVTCEALFNETTFSVDKKELQMIDEIIVEIKNSYTFK
ncbi:hypothetical protein [Vagococcus silagei]|uniref:Uncharacterized protein n=1 Tax=Vagococcus silagei TaxID=2508885 RepID=A0A4S3B589_9ENTE|nr:hypothetical protein [Vagococcus silagei]THB60783.1 hypothetical protein ESZ54_07385 [Vagococcus silagei]